MSGILFFHFCQLPPVNEGNIGIDHFKINMYADVQQGQNL